MNEYAALLRRIGDRWRMLSLAQSVEMSRKIGAPWYSAIWIWLGRAHSAAAYYAVADMMEQENGDAIPR